MTTTIRSRKHVLALSSLLLLGLPRPSVAQQATPAAPAKAAPSAPTFTLELKGTPLRQALETLFNNAHAQYVLDADVPDTPVTLVVRDQPLEECLRLLMRQGGGFAPRFTFTREARVYHIKAISLSSVPQSWEQIQVINIRPQDIQERLQTSFPECTVLTANGSPSLLVRASTEQLSSIRSMVNLLDVAPRNVFIKAEVVQVYASGLSGSAKKGKAAEMRNAMLSAALRTASGEEATGEDKITGTSAQTSRLQLVATPTLLGDGTYELRTRWQVSLPIPSSAPGANGKPGSLLRLEKLLSNVSRMRPGETMVIGGVVLSQYGAKGEILFFVTLTESR